MPTWHLKFGESEIYAVTGKTDASVDLRDIAESLGYSCQDDGSLNEEVSRHLRAGETYPVSERVMIWIGAARRVIVELKSEKSGSLVDWLDTQPTFDHLSPDCRGQSVQPAKGRDDRDHKTHVAVEQRIAREPSASPEQVAIDLGISTKDATDQLAAAGFIRRIKVATSE